METNYKQTDVAGEKWQRACRVQIDNPIGKNPSILFVEEEVVNLGDKQYTELVANLSAPFDVNNQLHVELYTKLNELYTLLRTARDEAANE